MSKGVFIAASISNSGTQGTFTGSSTADAIGIPGVGSVNDVRAYSLISQGSYEVDGGVSEAIVYALGMPSDWSMSLEVVLPGPADCEYNPYVNGSHHALNQLVLSPSTCGFEWHLERREARIFLIYLTHSLDTLLPSHLSGMSNSKFLKGIGFVDQATGYLLGNFTSIGPQRHAAPALKAGRG